MFRNMKTMAQLRDASASVKNAAQEIAAGNHDLSGRTEQAASSLRETASALSRRLGAPGDAPAHAG